MDSEEKHWTTDNELIERFVLNALDPDERNELEDHLRVCEVCKQIVRAEQVMQAGIRRAGREQFKAELGKKLTAEPQKKTPWVQILSAAAIVLILISVGIYNRWFEAQKESPGTIATAPLEPSPQSSQPAGKPLIAERSAEQHPAAPSKDARELVSRQRVAAQASRKSVASSDETVSGNIPAETGAGAMRAEPAQEMKPGVALADKAAQEQNESVVWLEGRSMLGPPAALYQKKLGYQRSVTDSHSGSSLAKEKAGYDLNSANDRIVLLQQAPAPLPDEQRKSAQHNSETIMTKAEYVGEKIRLTLYADPPLDDSTLAQAVVLTPGDDSLVVVLPNQRIGFRLPPDWNGRRILKHVK